MHAHTAQPCPLLTRRIHCCSKEAAACAHAADLHGTMVVAATHLTAPGPERCAVRRGPRRHQRAEAEGGLPALALARHMQRPTRRGLVPDWPTACMHAGAQAPCTLHCRLQGSRCWHASHRACCFIPQRMHAVAEHAPRRCLLENTLCLPADRRHRFPATPACTLTNTSGGDVPQSCMQERPTRMHASKRSFQICSAISQRETGDDGNRKPACGVWLAGSGRPTHAHPTRSICMQSASLLGLNSC